MPSLDELKATARALEPTHPVECRMLKEGLKGEWASGLHRDRQEALVRLHDARQKIIEAIALLEGTTLSGDRDSLDLAMPELVIPEIATQAQTQKAQKVGLGELRPAAALLVCQYYNLSKPFLQDGFWYALAPGSVIPQRLGQHLWLELCRRQSLVWIEEKIQELEALMLND